MTEPDFGYVALGACVVGLNDINGPLLHCAVADWQCPTGNFFIKHSDLPTSVQATASICKDQVDLREVPASRCQDNAQSLSLKGIDQPDVAATFCVNGVEEVSCDNPGAMIQNDSACSLVSDTNPLDENEQTIPTRYPSCVNVLDVYDRVCTWDGQCDNLQNANYVLELPFEYQDCTCDKVRTGGCRPADSTKEIYCAVAPTSCGVGYDWIQPQDLLRNHQLDCRLCPEEVLPGFVPTTPLSPSAPVSPITPPTPPMDPTVAPSSSTAPTRAPVIPTTLQPQPQPSVAPTTAPTFLPPQEPIDGLSPAGVITVVLLIVFLALTIVPGSIYLCCIWQQRNAIQQDSKIHALEHAEGIQTAPTADEDDEPENNMNNNDEEQGHYARRTPSTNRSRSSSPPDSRAAAQTIVQNSTNGNSNSARGSKKDAGINAYMDALSVREEEGDQQLYPEPKAEPSQDEHVLL